MEKYDTFCLTFWNLNDIFEYDEPYSMVIATGIAKLFQLCFEQACAAMNETLFKSGIGSECSSFRKILKDAYQCGMICDEQAWLSALEADADMESAYKKEIALKIVRDTKERFYPMFEALKAELEVRWI